ncbi:hypothetical protein [Allorhizocola rhizosphaerae]|uniref:hypothetical protein n=1 Tax=Allorhizocola rhizosphaerae TaxID=1872709 RepID=UPI000E3B8C82|nr:hypothetical protein [Allorhizocola rhizosphaerae]
MSRQAAEHALKFMINPEVEGGVRVLFVRDTEILELIHNTPWIAHSLAQFDFETARVENGPPEPVRLASGEPMEMVAGDAAGGAFMLVGKADPWPVVYVGSEGEGGLIAHSLRDALALVVGLSSIHDAMCFPAGEAGGARLREWLERADAELRADWSEIDDERARLRAALGLPEPWGLLEGMQAAQSDEAYRPINEEDEPFESML